MHSSSNAFDRVKSLLGKMDRSIDDARRRRLTDDGDEPEQPPRSSPDPQSQAKADQERTSAAPAAKTPEPPRPEAPPRTNSKYGRARPIRDLAGPNQPSWQRA